MVSEEKRNSIDNERSNGTENENIARDLLNKVPWPIIAERNKVSNRKITEVKSLLKDVLSGGKGRGETASFVYQMTEQGRSPIDIVIELGLDPTSVRELLQERARLLAFDSSSWQLRAALTIAKNQKLQTAYAYSLSIGDKRSFEDFIIACVEDVFNRRGYCFANETPNHVGIARISLPLMKKKKKRDELDKVLRMYGH